jgi:hypothetical protein
MKKQLICAAAILLAAVNSASAAPATNISFNGHCDGLTIKVKNGIYVTAPFTGCDSQYVAEGFLAKISKVDYLVLSTNTLGASYATTYVIQYPLATDNVYYVYNTSDGVTQTESDFGTYSLGTPTADSKDLPSTSHLR